MGSGRLRLLSAMAVGLVLTPAILHAEPLAEVNARDVAALADAIDQAIASKWTAQGVKPTHAADDAEFLRRVHLDLNGRIPTVAEVREFLDDATPNKRLRVVERLLQRPLYAEHFTTVWRELMLTQKNDREAQLLAGNLEAWLRRCFRENQPYDRMVRELLTADVAATNRRIGRPTGPEKPLPTAFYQINELKAENLAASTSRLFLGIKIECAQCHHHPFAKWSKKQFWEYAAFFSGIRPQEPRAGSFSPIKDDPVRRVIKVAGNEEEYEARFLDGREPRWKADVSTRTTLADWMTSADNPYFARNAANRVWAHFFGIGLIEPVDEPGPTNPPSHPELLDELARQFAAHQFDLKFLMRAITASKTYQLSSAATHPGRNDPRLFARMAVKGMSGEQLFDSLAVATGFQQSRVREQPNEFFAPRAEFVAKFSVSTEKRTDHQTSILQALSLMNGRLTSEVTNAEEMKNSAQALTLLAVADAPFFDMPAKRVETLYLATLSRKPRSDELDRFVKYLERGGPDTDAKKALADVFWALLNSSEFILNH
jgi:hypothetical protein